jgi:ferredoxin
MIEERSSRESWFGHMGRIDAVRLPMLSPDFREREVFCCGPEPFMRAAHQMLEASGFDMAHYHEESFGRLPVMPVEPPFSDAPPAEAPAQEAVPIRFATSDVEAPCLPGQTVLQAARAAGVRISAACEFGLCGTCKVMKTSGEVEMSHNGGILDSEITEGYILACCSKPLSQLEIEA